MSQDADCSGAESFALRVLGDDMAPEFAHGEIIVIEPGGALKDGAFVLAQVDGQWWFRQLHQCDPGWVLRALTLWRAVRAWRSSTRASRRASN